MAEHEESIRTSEEITDTPRETGYVKWFDNQKKYGFITRENKSDVFVISPA